MKLLITALLLCFYSVSFGQLTLSNAGVGFNFNNGQRVPNKIMSKFFPEQDLAITGSYNTSLNRVFSDYRVGFKFENRKAVYLETSLLQGTDYYDSYYYNYGTVQDSFSNMNTNVNSSLLGLRLMARFSTPMDRRVFVSACIGTEFLGAYDVEAEGQTNDYSSNFSNRTTSFFTSNAVSNYSSINLIQEIGISFKLGKKDKNYPLDHVYVQSHFQALSNFTIIDGSTQRYRTFGLILAMAYEF
jgi:hypothetical protein